MINELYTSSIKSRGVFYKQIYNVIYTIRKQFYYIFIIISKVLIKYNSILLSINNNSM